jgi:hypothetical protein
LVALNGAVTKTDDAARSLGDFVFVRDQNYRLAAGVQGIDNF